MNQFTITPHQILTRLARGERVSFVDARSEPAWRAEDRRLAGAVRAGPETDGAPHVLPGGLVVVYGEGGWELEPLRVAQQLTAKGHGNVRILSGGLRAWSAASAPAEVRAQA
jgi:3-mercaptopyruvate sulfurtransferase SseA